MANAPPGSVPMSSLPKMSDQMKACLSFVEVEALPTVLPSSLMPKAVPESPPNVPMFVNERSCHAKGLEEDEPPEGVESPATRPAPFIE